MPSHDRRSPLRARSFPALALALATAGCSASAYDDAVNGIDASDGVRLEVLSSHELGLIDGVFAGPDHRFAIVELRVDNESHELPLSTAYPLFSLRTDTGVEFIATYHTESLSNPCTAATLVAEDGSYECSVVFEIPHTQRPHALVYRPHPPLELSTELTSEPCSPCSDDCVDLQNDPAHCGECHSEIGAAQVCRDGRPACADAALQPCADECVDLDTDERHCGACSVAIRDDQVCRDGEAVCPDAAASTCGSECVDLETDERHCGQCNTAVQLCTGGQASCPAELLLCGTSCLDGTTDNANCGACDHACAGEFSCGEGGLCVSVRASDETIANCNGICGTDGSSCLYGNAGYVGTTYCPSGGGYDEAVVSIACNEVPEPTYEDRMPNGCSFLGSAYGMTCMCVQSD